MAISRLNEREYYKKIYGGWLGKNIGGTLGAPMEGKKELLNLTYYPSLPDGPLPNDDLDLQLVWLHALEQYGVRLTAAELGQEWVEHVFFPYDEYGYALANLRRGLVAPVAGWFNNPFTHCMGSPIRSEIWAMVTPGSPQLAAYYAYQDAIVDHAGGEGVYGEMFFAAIESAAFTDSNRDRLIRTGLQYIPDHCRTARAVKDLLVWHAEGKTWLEARELILERHGSSNFTDAPQNIAFTVLGWLYGEDFGDAILKAVNCGYDTDCTGATLGAILGIIQGADQLPEYWVKPVGDGVAVSPPIKGFPAPRTLDELTERTVRIGKRVAAEWNLPLIIDKDAVTHWAAAGEWQADDDEYDVKRLWNRKSSANVYYLPKGTSRNLGLELTVDYGLQGPAIGLEQRKTIGYRLMNRSKEAWEGVVRLDTPVGWQGSDEQRFSLPPGAEMEGNWTIRSDAKTEPVYRLSAHIVRLHDGHEWNTETVDFRLVAATEWSIGADGGKPKRAVFQGNRIHFEDLPKLGQTGSYRASTTMIIPSDRDVRLITATVEPVKAWLNGRLIINSPVKQPFMPAFHRAPAKQLAELTLPRGEHLLEIEVAQSEDPPELYVLAVSQRTTGTPGSFYYYSDVLFIAKTDGES
ncbi:ADP-ribosylglycohydrolase family protein [Paenibacillus allorhizosphaerae]|uniref:ADP-ribosylglycohydrolase family protein n=1 Tax=Paenibacillus allorhizosphaerae TaxID=2849866 RepID=A0ABN7TFP3_9BACL|nr:ADP-ribosylglycohydrolase family protein [Paenibacillus allorhizosphaerae]CAG7625306.1 hypothetical protein PAECIP111802_01155 [Paenibacillus allorhizosphaerae]